MFKAHTDRNHHLPKEGQKGFQGVQEILEWYAHSEEDPKIHWVNVGVYGTVCALVEPHCGDDEYPRLEIARSWEVGENWAVSIDQTLTIRDDD